MLALIRAQRKNLEAVGGHQHGVLPLGGQLVVFGHHSPAVRQQFYVSFARVDHGLDGECHAFAQHVAGAGLAIMQYLWILMKDPPDAMSTVLANNRKSIFFNMLLNGVADVPKPLAGCDLLDAEPHAFVRNLRQPLCLDARFVDEKHTAGITVKAVLDDGDVDIDRITGLELALARNAVADDVID